MGSNTLNSTEGRSDDWYANLVSSETSVSAGNLTAKSLGNKRVGIAIVGLGRIGRLHLRNIMREPRARLLYACDINSTSLQSLSRSFMFDDHGIKAIHFSQLDLILRDENVKGVLIASPTSTHFELTKRALEAGKNVMCEKPLSPNDIEGIRKLHQLAATKNLFLLTAFNRRYDPDFRDIYAKIKEGSLGNIYMVRITARDNELPPLTYIKDSSGMFHDTCVHDFDAALWLIRQLPTSVQVMGRTWKEYYADFPDELKNLSGRDRKLLPEIDDFIMVIITLKFPNNALCLIDNSRLSHYGYDQRCEVHGSKGMMKLDGKRTLETVYLNQSSSRQSALTTSFISRYSAAYENELRDFVKMIRIQARSKDDQEVLSENLMEPVRGTLIYASAVIAEKCRLAAIERKTIEFDWSEDIQNQFKLDIC